MKACTCISKHSVQINPVVKIPVINHILLFSEYKNWYLEDGDPVVKPKSDDDIELITNDNGTTKEINDGTEK